MADRYWVGNGAAVWSTSGASSGWAATSGGAPGQTPPTTADDVYLDALSPALTMNGGNCRSLNCVDGTGGAYANTLTHSAGNTLVIGPGVGTGNVALKFSAAMTYTLGSATTSALTFTSTSATQASVTWAGKTPGNVTFSGATGNWKMLDGYSAPTTTFTYSSASTAILDLNGQTFSWATATMSSGTLKTLTLGAAAVTCTSWQFRASTVTANTAVVTQPNATSLFDTAASTGANYNGMSLVQSGSGTATVGSSAGSAITLGNYTRTGTAVKTDVLSIGNNLTVTGTLTITGNSIVNRICVQSSVTGTQRTLTAAAVSLSHVDFMDMAGGGAAAPFTSVTNLGDCQGNTGITFPASATQTHTASAGGNWSDATKWTSRVPLPQDDVVVDANTTGTLTLDMPRLGRSINFTGFVGTASRANVAQDIYGSITLATGMVWDSIATGTTITMRGRGSHTITTNGKVWNNRNSNPGGLTIDCATGTYTLADTLVVNSVVSNGSGLIVNSGTLNTAGFAVTLGAQGTDVVVNTAGTLTLGASVVTIGGLTGTVWQGLGTVSAANATIILSGATANTRTFAGGGKTYGTLTYTVAGSTGTLVITGSNTFGTLNFSDASNARTLQFTAATTTTFTTSFNVRGTAGKLMTVGSVTAANHTLLLPAQTETDYLSVSRSTLSTRSAYAGAHSIDGGNNSTSPGWIFTATSGAVSSSWGTLAGAANGTRTTSGTTQATWGALAGAATGTVTVTATAQAAWGGLASTANGEVTVLAGTEGTWGGLAGAAVGTVTVTGVADGAWGSQVGIAAGVATRAGVAVGLWGGLTGSATPTFSAMVCLTVDVPGATLRVDAPRAELTVVGGVCSV